MMREGKVEVYEALDGWRWRLKAGNGQILADGAESYTRREDAERAVRKAYHLFTDAAWLDVKFID